MDRNRIPLVTRTHPEIVGQSRLILFSNATTLVVNKPWNMPSSLTSLPSDTKYEISLFSGLSIPNVRAQIFSSQTPALVVFQTGRVLGLA